MNPTNKKYYKFYGDMPPLVPGIRYSMQEYSEVSGVSVKCLNNRRSRYKNPPIDNDFLKPVYTREPCTLESEADVFSDSWLRKKLTTCTG